MTPREIVKQFVETRWSDQKIAEVFAFNQDGKMSYRDSCACLVGADSSSNLHSMWDVPHCSMDHYLRSVTDESARAAESAYLWLFDKDSKDYPGDLQRIFGQILEEIMAEREALKQTQVEVLQA